MCVLIFLSRYECHSFSLHDLSFRFYSVQDLQSDVNWTVEIIIKRRYQCMRVLYDMWAMNSNKLVYYCRWWTELRGFIECTTPSKKGAVWFSVATLSKNHIQSFCIKPKQFNIRFAFSHQTISIFRWNGILTRNRHVETTLQNHKNQFHRNDINGKNLSELPMAVQFLGFA